MRFAIDIFDQLIEIRIVIDPPAFTFYADSRSDHIARLSGIYHRLHAEILYMALLEIIGRCEQQGGLGRSHCAVAKI